MRLFIFIISLLCVNQSFALLYEGTVIKVSGQAHFVSSIDKKKYTLLGATPLMSTYVNKLSDGDFISIEGTKNADQTALSISSVNYIGLKSLIGTWFADSSTCFHFLTYTDFTISRRAGNTCVPQQNVNYTYIINPSSVAWVILISGERGSYVGDVSFVNTKNVQVDLYDSETGEIVRQLNLQKKK